MEFAGQAAIVTGVAGGFGRAISRRLARGGARVVAADINLPGAEETAALVRQDGGEALATHLNIASIAARNGGTMAGIHYVASKGGVLAMTKKLGKELGQYGIVVNGLNPGTSRTEMTATWPRQLMEGIIKNTPLGRLVEPEDIADAVAFLASDAARFVHGETIEVNGGIFCD